MSGIGGWEVLILVMIGLVVLGPKRLPQVANQLGSWIGQARRMTRAMRRQLEDELDVDDNFQPKSPRIAPPVASESDPDPGDEDGVGEPEPYIPSEDDTYSPIHDGEDDGDDSDNDSDSDSDSEPEKKA